MREREHPPLWAFRLWSRRLERHGNERIVRWIALPDKQRGSIASREIAARVGDVPPEVATTM